MVSETLNDLELEYYILLNKFYKAEEHDLFAVPKNNNFTKKHKDSFYACDEAWFKESYPNTWHKAKKIK